MTDKKGKNKTVGNESKEQVEDVTMYGEFIASFDNWTTPDKQRERARHLAEVTEEISPDVKNKSSKKRSN